MSQLPDTVVINTQGYKILTPHGYENFLGVNKITKNEYIHLIFSNGKEIKCSLDHPFITLDGLIKAKELKKTTEVVTKDGKGCFLLTRKTIRKKIELYDIVNSGVDHTYYSNDILSHNCAFLGSTDTLISGSKLQSLVDQKPRAIRNGIKIYHEPINEEWDDNGKQINIEHKYVCCVDTSEGKKLDSSAFTIVDITDPPYKVVAVYADNTIAPLLYPSIIYSACKYYNDAYVLIESMTVGQQVADILHSDLEYENILRTSSGNKKSQQISAGHLPGALMGVKTTAPVKRIGCQNLKTLIETDQLLNGDETINDELKTFVLNTRGSYEAESGAHDDLVMTLVLFSWLSTQAYFKELVTHDLRKQLKQQFLDFDDQEMLPAFAMDNGLSINLEQLDNSLWISREDSMGDPYNPYGRLWS